MVTQIHLITQYLHIYGVLLRLIHYCVVQSRQRMGSTKNVTNRRPYSNSERITEGAGTHGVGVCGMRAHQSLLINFVHNSPESATMAYSWIKEEPLDCIRLMINCVKARQL